MVQRSAGILLFRKTAHGVEVLLGHPGGPFWQRKDDGAWTIPKGAVDPGEDDITAARREFAEEMGGPAPPAEALSALGAFRQPGGKIVVAFIAAGDYDVAALRSITFSMQWPPRSGKMAEFPEIDRAGWFGLGEAEAKIIRGQRPMIAALRTILAGRG